MPQTNVQVEELDASVPDSRFGERLAEYGDWRNNLLADIRKFQDWLQSEGFKDAEDELRIYELLESLKQDKLSVALVAEFSRGKTELINAIFFADHKRRLLPSSAGRTTMCPTEIQFNEGQAPCIMLLPIETRKNVVTITEYKRSPVNWSTIPLNIESPKEMSETMQEIIKTKTVSAREAKELGLYPQHLNDRDAPEKVEIPVWRHAIINYPHPLLKEGLVVLDTPGLNALGTEPELTLNMLPNAHAVMFVLAADTGVTKTDLEMWSNHVRVATRRRAHGRIAVLNKIDTLWDDLQDDSEINAAINRQVAETSRILDIDREDVFPVSAQKGLIGKVKNNPALLARSGLTGLEIKLSTDIIAAKQELVRNKVIADIGGMIEATAATVQARLDSALQEYNELATMRGKSQDVLRDMANRLREQKARYTKEVESFEITRRMLSEQVKNLLGHMSMKSFDKLIGETRQSMQETWTTAGLRRGMSTFFKGAGNRMERVNNETRQIKALVDSIYDKFHTQHGLAKVRPSAFSVLPYRSEFKRLETEAEAFRDSLAVVITEQHFVVKKFFITLVSRAREIFNECNRSTKSWARAILTPIYTQIQEHKIMIDRRLENLEKIQHNHAALSEKITELEGTIAELKKQHETMAAMKARISQPPAPSN